jgi:FKBP12-rapamycin complex-associated protein
MLGHLVSRAPRLIKPYMEPILKVLIPKLKDPDPNPGVLICVLLSIGELAQVNGFFLPVCFVMLLFVLCQVSGVEMRRWIEDLLPFILEFLQDSSSVQKREVCYFLVLLSTEFHYVQLSTLALGCV